MVLTSMSPIFRKTSSNCLQQTAEIFCNLVFDVVCTPGGGVGGSKKSHFVDVEFFIGTSNLFSARQRDYSIANLSSYLDQSDAIQTISQHIRLQLSHNTNTTVTVSLKSKINYKHFFRKPMLCNNTLSTAIIVLL